MGVIFLCSVATLLPRLGAEMALVTGDLIDGVYVYGRVSD